MLTGNKNKFVLLYISVFFLLSINAIGAPLICGEISNAYDGTEPAWREVVIYTENTEPNNDSCIVNAWDNVYCCDPDLIPSYDWNAGDILHAKMVDNEGNYVSNSVSLTTDYGAYNVAPVMQLLAIVSIDAPSTTAYDEDSVVVNATTIRDYNDTIWYSFDGGANITLCRECNFSEINIEDLADGEYLIQIYANDSENNVRTNYAYFTVDAVSDCGDGTCSPDETCSTCPQDCGVCSGGGGGGGAGSAAPTADQPVAVAPVEIIQKKIRYQEITPDKPVNVVLDGMAIESISIFTKKKVKNVGMAVKSVLPAFAASEPPGIAYSQFEIVKRNMDDDDVEKVVFTFKVEKTWLQTNQLTENDVYLYNRIQKTNQWEKLNTIKVDEDEKFVYFKAEGYNLENVAISGITEEEIMQEIILQSQKKSAKDIALVALSVLVFILILLCIMTQRNKKKIMFS